MAVTLPAFTPLEDSLYLTLCARALDNRRPHPILGDATADQIVRSTDYEYDKLDIKTNLILNVALRAKKLDQVASDFLTRHPDAVGLDLGAGLDTRFERLAPPATVDWYDVDFPAVATARQRLIPEHPNAHIIGADVRDQDWLDAVPDRPASCHRRRRVIGDLFQRLLGEDLRVRAGLLDGLRILRPVRGKRRVASLAEQLAPAVPAARQQPDPVNEDNRRVAGGVRRLDLPILPLRN
jgi:Leucine carboxyl methyltransferase